MTITLLRGHLFATAVAAALLLTSAAYAADAPPAPKLSGPVAKQLVTAQKAMGTKDWPTVKTALDAAKEVSGRTDYDNYIINQFTMVLDAQTNDMAGATAAAQASADSPAQPDADKEKNLKTAAQLSMQTNQYDKALVYAKQLQTYNPTDTGSLQTLAEIYYFTKDYTNAGTYAQKAIDSVVAAKKTPPHEMLQVLLSSQVKNKDEAGAEQTLEMGVGYYNKPEDWQQIIDVTLGSKGLRDLDAIWLGRLMFLSGATVSAQDASLFGSTASHLTFFGDAQVAQQHGGTGFPDANASATKDKQTIAAQIAGEQKANGQYSAKLAEALYSYGMYPEAEAAARLAIQKGGVKDSSEAPMVLGQALVAQGKYDDAVAAFGQVTGGGPATPRTTRLWVTYANIKKNPPAVAAK